MSGHCELCREDIEDGSLHGILDHLRVIHPDEYGDGPERWPDGAPVVVVDDDALKPEDFGEAP